MDNFTFLGNNVNSSEISIAINLVSKMLSRLGNNKPELHDLSFRVLHFNINTSSSYNSPMFTKKLKSLQYVMFCNAVTEE